ncbi:hypothetical protein HELRODRAFT_173110 [Helobdella robusta]|uniref:Endonuclease/exonuclease/phosphatase domain-containing protein n=1 Tax=Helobdella robusta TaxID=6412 RepID=T1F6D4_HELRO|nr:hypothetical protein HELRODRAFT_173110 [Helobdella robusta]ESO04039.1 hypothetical protein HELRODRAFT_173110 [Helobdella robusta]
MGIRLLNVRLIASNVNGVHGLICDGLDVLVLTKTWHGTVGNNSVRLAMPPGFWYVDYVRQHDLGHGGLIVYFRQDFGYKKFVLPIFVTFETIAIRFSINGYQFILLAIYRPDSMQISSLFFDELVSVLEYLTMLNANILMMGDFNVHVEKVVFLTRSLVPAIFRFWELKYLHVKYSQIIVLLRLRH